jgi:hypothetical protein
VFISATLDGTISGWNPAVDSIVSGASHDAIARNRSEFGAQYTGLAMASSGGKSSLFAP